LPAGNRATDQEAGGTGREVTRRALLCEVTTHLGGLLILRRGREATAEVVREKVESMRDFAELTFPDFEHRFEWWSPRVAEGR
jgi:hypothetical protein